MTRLVAAAFVALCLVVCLPTSTSASSAADAVTSLHVRVLDATGAVIAGATVTVRQGQATPRTAVTSLVGDTTVEALEPGRVELRVEAQGFEPRVIGSQRVRAGENHVDVTLQIAKLAVQVDVARSLIDQLLDPRGQAFTRVLSPEMIAQLPDDPDEMQRVLEQIAGPGAVIRVNGFGGSRLPPKGQIRQIRISQTLVSAETHEFGVPTVDIQTQPGIDNWHTSMGASFRHGPLTARYPFSSTAPTEGLSRGSVTLDGPLWRKHTSLSLNVDLLSSSDAQTYLATTPDGQIAGSETRPLDRSGVTLEVEHALTKTHTARLELASNRTTIDRLGVGGSNLPERAYRSRQSSTSLRLSDSGPIGKTLFNEVRLQSVWGDQHADSATAAPAVVVLDAFGAGGAQVSNRRRNWDVEVADNLDVARGRHAMRVGALVQAGRYDASDESNRLGTFTFSSLAQYVAGRPATFTMRTGDPLVGYSFVRAGWYFQDDVKLHKTLSLSAGLRHEVQSHVDGSLNLSPRIGGTWAPLPNAKLTIRGGVGLIYNWYDPTVYEQTLRVDGVRQFDLVVTNPGFPDPLAGAQPIVLPPSRLQAADDLSMPRILHATVSMQTTWLNPWILMSTVTHQQGRRLLRGRNLNAPLANGVRPYPQFGNITQTESTGRSSMDRFDLSLSRVALGKRPLMLMFMYSLGRQMNDTDGAFSVPANAIDADADWGPASNDIRHRFTSVMSGSLPKSFRAQVMITATSATPYNITTGFDNNGDAVFNDRPAGVGRNSARGSGVIDVTARIGWTFGFGKPPTAQDPLNIRRLRNEASRGDVGSVLSDALGGRQHRYRMELYGQAYNALNRVNYTGYRGVMTSPYFGTATASLPPRRIELGIRFDF
jgi:hypothetical protein